MKELPSQTQDILLILRMSLFSKQNPKNHFPLKREVGLVEQLMKGGKEMRKLQQQRIANRERNTQNQETRPLWEEELDRQLADFHMFGIVEFGNVEGGINLNQVADPQFLPLFPNQPMELEQNQESQLQIPAFDPNEIPRIPTPNPLDYDPWWDDNRSVMEILNNPYPYGEPIPRYPDPVPALMPPMTHESVAELCQYGEELVEEGNRIRQIEKKLVKKYDKNEMLY